MSTSSQERADEFAQRLGKPTAADKAAKGEKPSKPLPKGKATEKVEEALAKPAGKRDTEK